MNLTTIIGIDPGAVTAAYGVIDNGMVYVNWVPVVERNVDAAEFARIIRAIRPDVAILEKVGAMPRQGVSSTFRFGLGTGLLKGVILGLGIPLLEVRPNEWKAYYKLGKDKEKSRARAISLFPGCREMNLKKDADKAEALLMANWFLETRPSVDLV
jgi:crossover junction endodeoxyribonuclease RuvC